MQEMQEKGLRPFQGLLMPALTECLSDVTLNAPSPISIPSYAQFGLLVPTLGLEFALRGLAVAMEDS